MKQNMYIFNFISSDPEEHVSFLKTYMHTSAFNVQFLNNPPQLQEGITEITVSIYARGSSFCTCD